MKRSPLCLVKYVIAFSIALIAVSNCFNVLSNSSSSPAFRVDGVSSIDTPKPGKHNSSPGLLAGANRDLSRSESHREGALTALISGAGPETNIIGGSSVASPFAPSVSATKSHALAPGDTQADPGDTLTYTVIISNTGSTDATGVNFTDTIDPNTTLVGGSTIASPIAVDDSYHTIGNVNISVPVGQGVIANDLNPNGAGTLTVTKVNSTPVPGGGSASDTTAHGSVTLSSDGSFTYTPNAGDRAATDSFSYTLENGTGKTDTANVTITLNGMIWFVDNTAGPAGDGRLVSPFRALTGAGSFDAGATDAANDVIFIYTGTSDYTGGLTLLGGQKIIGQGAGQSIETITGFATPSGNAVLPATSGANPTVTTGGAGINSVNLGTNNEIWGVTFGNTSGAGIAGTSFGTLKVRDTAKTGNGQALNLSTGTLDAIFQSLASTNSAGTGMTVNAAAGSLTVTGATSVTNSAGSAVNLTNNTGTLIFAALDITNNTANTSGLVATDNSGTITTTSGAINTGTATAVNISKASGTTPLNITLTSVSSNGGTASGIMIQNTGGSFTVNGDGANTAKGGNATGGTIANKDDGGTDGTTNVGTGVFLSNATNITLRRVQLNDLKNFGIRGLSVTGFTLQYSTINGANGDTAAGTEGSVSFGTPNPGGANGMLGSGLIDNCKISGGVEHNMEFYNQSGNLNALTISNSDVKSNSAATGGDGIQMEMDGSASTTVSIQTCLFDDNRSQAVQTTAVGSSTVDLTINGCTLQRTTQGTEGFVLQNAASAHMTLHVTNNNCTGINGAVILVGEVAGNATSASSMSAVISGNTITHATTATNSAIIAFLSSTIGQTASSNILIDSNTVTENGTSGVSRGIFVDTPDASTTPSFTATVTNNNVSVGDNAAGLQGIVLQSRRAAGCFDVRGNTVTFPNGTPPGINGLRLRQVNPGTAQLEQGASAGTAAVVLAANNPASTTEVLGTVTVVGNNACQVAPLSLQPVVEIASQSKSTSDGDSSERRGDTLVAVMGQRPDAGDVAKVSDAELYWMVQAAIDRWRQAGVSVEDLARLQEVTFEIADLADGQLATASGSRIRIDETAAGYGWFFDQSPQEDSEFDVPVPGRELQTTELSPVHGKIDLLTVVMRELGTIYLQNKNRIPKNLRPLMEGTLSPAVRRMPVFNIPDRSTSSLKGSGGRNSSVAATAPAPSRTSSAAPIPAVFNPSTDLMSGSYGARAKRMSYAANASRSAAAGRITFSGETVNLSIGTIPAGESVTIMFQVTIDNPFPNGVCTVTNQGHVTGTNFSQVDTNIDVTPVAKAVTISACPANVTVNNDPGLCTAVVTYTTPTGDGCPVPTVTCNPTSGSAFAKGTTTVTCTASNGNPPDATCTFTVTVNDNQPPVITCPANVTQGTDPGLCSAVVTYANATATDNCTGVGTPVCTPASGTVFNKGTTTVSCTVSDASSNSASCSFTVTVNDTTAPAITCPANVTQSTDPNQCTAVVTYANATATDNCPGVGTPVCAPASGSTFVLGVTTVTCTVSDASSNSASCSFTVTVKDTQAPSLGPCPANISVTSGGGCQVVNYTPPTATDNCGGATVVCSPPSGFCFAPGTTTVTCTASDSSPDSPDTSCSFMVTVIPCAITCPSNISVNNTPNQCGAIVTYAPTFGGGCGTVTCTPSSGSFFPVGSTTVSCITQAGPACSFTVTVVDAQPPTITTCPANRTLSTNGGNQIALPSLTGEVVATDNCTPSGSLVITQSPVAGTMIGLGNTLVTITVKDAANNQSTCTVTITVVKFAAKDFVVFSSESTKLSANAVVNTGNVGANTSLPDPNGPPDDKEEVEIGERVTMLQAGSSVVGDTVRLRANSQVYNVYFNESFFSPSATILGSQVTPQSLPVTTMPAFPTVTAGTTDVVVPANSTVTLAPGSYRNVTVNNKGTLKLTGGLYQISSLDIRQEANIFCLAQSEIRVKIEMDTDAKAFIGPDPSAPTLQASQIVFYVEGADGGGGLSPTSVQIGERNTVFANIYAPNGTVVLKANTTATGAFIGKQAQVGERVELTLKSAF